MFLINYLVRFNTNNKRHFVTYFLTRVSDFTTYICFIIVSIHLIVNLSIFNDEDGTTINNEDGK